MAISAVARSRISPTMMTLGSWRRIECRPSAKVKPILGWTLHWLMPGSFISTGSSRVTMFRVGELSACRKV